MGGFLRIKNGITMDSGSAAFVMPTQWLPMFALEPSAGSTRGAKYVGATGNNVPNRGEADICFWTPDGQQRLTTFQNASVGMPILSISKVTEEGNDVIFRRNGGEIIHLETGHRTPLIKRLGVYFVKLKVPKNLLDEDFGRPAP